LQAKFDTAIVERTVQMFFAVVEPTPDLSKEDQDQLFAALQAEVEDVVAQDSRVDLMKLLSPTDGETMRLFFKGKGDVECAAAAYAAVLMVRSLVAAGIWALPRADSP